MSRSQIITAFIISMVIFSIFTIVAVEVKRSSSTVIKPKADTTSIMNVVERKQQMLSLVTYVLVDDNGNRYLYTGNQNGGSLVLMPPAPKEDEQ